MQLSLSTNWNSHRHECGEAIVEEALAVGCDSLELGFRLRPEHVPGIRARLDECPVRSVHAFSPVPVSAPYGHPELHALASRDEDERSLAAALVAKCIAFAGDMGASAVILHAGRVGLGGFFRRVSSESFEQFVKGRPGPKLSLDREDARYVKLLASARARLRARSDALMVVFCAELEKLDPLLEKHGVVLALENLPYFEAFPDEEAMEKIAAAYPRVKAWFDTGHARVRASFGWADCECAVLRRQLSYTAGCHINDVFDFDDNHLPAGAGNVDFAALSALADGRFIHVMEPGRDVAREDLEKGVEYLRSLWTGRAAAGEER